MELKAEYTKFTVDLTADLKSSFVVELLYV